MVLSTTKTGRHDIAEILLKVALNTINTSINQSTFPNFQLGSFITCDCELLGKALDILQAKKFSFTYSFIFRSHDELLI
jgi:hypothetical protein